MVDYIQTTPEQWVALNGFQDAIISHPHAGEQYQLTVSDALKQFGRLIIAHAVETCDAHSDTDIDKEGAEANLLRQFGLKK